MSRPTTVNSSGGERRASSDATARAFGASARNITCSVFSSRLPVTNGLALLPYSNTPHYDSEPGRRPLYQKLVGDGVLPGGWATDDGVGLHFRGTELVEAVADRPAASAWQVRRGDDGTAVETAVETRLLPDPRG